MKNVMKMVIMTLVLWVGSVSMTASNEVVRVRIGENVVLDFSRLFPDLDPGPHEIRFYKEGEGEIKPGKIEINGFILYIRNVTHSDAGVYVCEVRNQKGVYRAAIALIVEDV